MGSDVLFSGVSQHIVDTFLVAVTTHCSVRLIRSRPVVRAVAVIECNQPALGQALGRFAPPSDRCGRKFGAVLIRQYIEQLAWPSGEQHAPSGVRRIHPSPTKRIVTPRHTPLKPVALGLAPADSVHRKGIEQFVTENDTSNLRQRGDRIDPLDFLFKLGQTLRLPSPPPCRWFNDVVSQRLQQRLIVFGQPSENVVRQSPVMCAGLDQPYRAVDAAEPLSESTRKQLAKRRAHAHARDEVATSPHPTSLCLVVAPVRMVQRQLHVPGKRHRPARLNLGADFFSEWVRSLRHGGHCD